MRSDVAALSDVVLGARAYDLRAATTAGIPCWARFIVAKLIRRKPPINPQNASTRRVELGSMNRILSVAVPT